MNFHRTFGNILTGRLTRMDEIVMKYQTNMNLSGRAVGCVERDYDVENQKLDFINTDFTEKCWFPNQHLFFFPKCISHASSLQLLGIR